MSWFAKTYVDRGTAVEALRRTRALRRQGLTTPEGQWCDFTTLLFQHIEGECGLHLLGHDLSYLIAPLAGLHRAQVSELRPCDPFLRIRPRLHLMTSHIIRGALAVLPQGGTATIHGDFHVGQLIRTKEGKVWIIDLDDLAIGPPEADFANFAAHLATSDVLGVRQALAPTAWAEKIMQVQIGQGQPCDRDLFLQYFRIALIRRHLKLREAGRPDFEQAIEACL